MAAMQLLPDELARLMRPPPPRDVPVIFYLGCNAIRTPHVLFNAMYVLDALAIDYEVLGGPAACCGIIHSKWEGEIEAGERITDGTLDRFASYRPEKVLSWCPSCQLHLGESLASFRRVGFDFDHVTKFMVEQETALRARFNTPVKMRVLLHTHEGMADLGGNVARLLGAVPGLTIAGTAGETGYTCGGSGADRSPALKAAQREETLRRAREPGIDALVTLYHGCHMQLAAAGRQHGFGVLNFTDILVRALGGTPREDALEALRMLGDWRDVVTQAAPHLQANGIEFEPGQLAQLLPEVFALAEFSGGLEAFASPRRGAETSAQASSQQDRTNG
jgi:Fe-S oxidoreductase